MKSCYVGMLIMLIGHRAIAQVDTSTHLKNNTNIRICVPSKSQLLNNPPLIVIKSHNEIISFIDSSSLKMNALNPTWIKQINVYKDSANTTLKYGPIAKNGVIEIFLNDKKYPNAFEVIKKATTHN